MIKTEKGFVYFKNSSLMLILFAVLLFIPQHVSADAENDMLKARIEKLENELKELKSIINKKDTGTADKTTAKPSAPGSSKGFVIKPYGYVKLDASYDDSKVATGNYVVYVPSEGTVENDNEFNFTARQTRIGLDVTAPEFDGWKAKGKVEIDFYGDGPTAHETKAEPFMRHAFLEVSKEGLSFIAGQTWDVISPLNPSTVNYPVGWGAGNIGYRRPQVRVSYNKSFNSNTGLLTQFALSRTTGMTNEDLDGGGQNDGEDSGFPTMQGRVALTTPGLAGKKTVIGISGHYGQEEVDWAGAETDLASWSGNVDFNIPLSERFTLSGEAFIGENIDDYFGGAIQGVNTVTRDEISSTGMWAQIKFIADKKWQYNAGFGLDNPDYDDINDGMRDKNSFYFLNTMVKVLPNITLGFEYTRWITEYKNAEDGTDNRFQTSATFSW